MGNLMFLKSFNLVFVVADAELYRSICYALMPHAI